MKMKTLLEVIQAAHWTWLVESEWRERGGIMLVAPPASFKTTFIKTLDMYHDSLILSDANTQTLIKLRDDISNSRYRTLGFTEFEKLYQRNPQVALNVEGHVKAFVEEGFKTASFEDARMPGLEASCLVVGGLTPSCVRKNWERWTDSGFARRFLWAHYKLKDGNIIADAIDLWKKLSFESAEILNLKNKMIPYSLTAIESKTLRTLCKHQRGQETPFALLKKIACVLKRKEESVRDSKPGQYMKTMSDFAESLTGTGALLEL